MNWELGETVNSRLSATAAIALGCDTAEITLEQLSRGTLADSVEVLIARRVRSATGQISSVVILYSPPFAPFAASAAATKAQAAAAALGPILARPVLRPLMTGMIEERSYVVAPALRHLSRSRLGWFAQRHLVIRGLFPWLLAVTKKTASRIDLSKIREQFILPLEAMADTVELSQQIRKAAGSARARLFNRDWTPFQCLMHGDLWRGNVMLQPGLAPLSRRFMLIDWGGTSVDGYPIFDLVRAAQSFRVSNRRLRLELARHCLAVECRQDFAVGYVLAALGKLALEPGCFPPPSLHTLAETMQETMDRALGGANKISR